METVDAFLKRKKEEHVAFYPSGRSSPTKRSEVKETCLRLALHTTHTEKEENFFTYDRICRAGGGFHGLKTAVLANNGGSYPLPLSLLFLLFHSTFSSAFDVAFSNRTTGHHHRGEGQVEELSLVFSRSAFFSSWWR